MTRIAPLVLLAGALVGSAAMAAVDPLARPSLPLHAAGALLAGGGAAVAVGGVVAFRRRRTTVDSRFPERASALVEDGVYRWTRNPMYVGFVGVAIGGAAALGSALALVRPGLLAAYLDRVQIPAEERALRARFGTDFDDYTGRVGRWLGRNA